MIDPSAPAVLVADVRVLALGDSYTIGEGVPADERWPVRLAAMLRARGIPTAPPTIVARTGWTTDELSAGLEAAPPGESFDLATLLVGVNDQYRGRASAEYRARFRPLLDDAIKFVGGRPGRVIVVSIPDWGVTPFGMRNDGSPRDPARIAAEIDAFNAINRDEAGRVGAQWVDVTAISRRAASEPGLVASDGLHPSGAMYAEWARVVLPVAIRELS